MIFRSKTNIEFFNKFYGEIKNNAFDTFKIWMKCQIIIYKLKINLSAVLVDIMIFDVYA